MTRTEHVDVLVVGAGLSGVAAGYYLQTLAPDRSYTILEARQTMGGTWDLFRYPGIRSDSDMYTLGYSFRPWRADRAIVDGASILQYIKDTAAEYDIERKIRYGHRVVSAAWSSADALWTLQVQLADTGERITFTTRFVISCAGYYDFDRAHTPDFPGRDDFEGQVAHPQFWRDDIDYDGKRIVVIGSGATAVSLVPALAEKAAKVTMLQRSPGYTITMPTRNRLLTRLRDRLPEDTGPTVLRWIGVLATMGIYYYCRAFPRRARARLMNRVRAQLPSDFDVDVHFNPRYDPWDQRLCLVPHGDLFRAIRTGKAEVVTDHVERFTRDGILLRSGARLPADLIVTATGLELRMFGGIEATVDGRVIHPGEAVCYRGSMFSDVPNFAMVLGYTKASWTLKCELVLRYVMRLLSYMDERGYQSVVPEQNDPTLVRTPLIDMESGYFVRARDWMPKTGSREPWKFYQNYLRDRRLIGRAPLDDGTLVFRRVARAGQPGASVSQGAA